MKNPKTNRKNAGFTDEESGEIYSLLDAGLLIRSAIFIRRQRGFIPGGPIVSVQGRKMRGGALIISVCPSA